ncbi:MAG: hypothetical protein AB1656_03230 [Candidatus Omnitrophota bacterium]
MLKKSIILFVGLIMAAVPSFATTKTVGKSGAQFTSIQKAIDSFTEAEVTDGTPDVVEIIDSAEYDEQVMIGGLIPDPDLKFPETQTGYLDSVIALTAKRDPFTLRGKDPANRPKINPVSPTPVTYGVFTNDVTDHFIATFSYLGININVENIEILQSSVIDADQYGMNGQAGQATFKNVLFAHSGDASAGEALINFNNAADIAGQGFDNSYYFVDCAFDGAINGERSEINSIYFHGYTSGDATEAGVNIEDIAANMTFENCKFLNAEEPMVIRGRDQANNVTLKNCFFSNNLHGARGAGKGSLMVENCIFTKNAIQTGDFENETGAVETAGRSGFTPSVTVKNSLFVDNFNRDEVGDLGINSKVGSILIKNDGTDPDVSIEQCTFVNDPIAIRFHDASGRPRKATVNNNIFKNAFIVLTADAYFGNNADANDDGLIQNVIANGSGNIFDANKVVVEEQDKLPNVKIQGSDASVVFNNPAIATDDPFSGPPYKVASGAPVGVGADLSPSTTVGEFMLY